MSNCYDKTVDLLGLTYDGSQGSHGWLYLMLIALSYFDAGDPDTHSTTNPIAEVMGRLEDAGLEHTHGFRELACIVGERRNSVDGRRP